MKRAVDRMFLHPLKQTARARVVCFPYAGGTASVFNGLLGALPSDLDVCAFEPPGRQKRGHEPLVTDMDALLQPLLDESGWLLDRPCVFLGHSLGSWMAFELARKLREVKQRLPVAMVLAGARAPQLPRPRALSALPDDVFMAELRAMNGTPSEVLDDPELMAYVQPRIRADFALGERYAPRTAPALQLPFVVLGGSSDRWVQAAHLQAWSVHCAGEFQLQLLPGDHFFIHSQQRALCALLEHSLARHANPARAGGHGQPQTKELSSP
jgi:medium-chain acyl-[acyl-carrier-protein] hydrolase